MPKLIPYEEFAHRNSRVAFRRYVTRVAFQLTLSEPMIAALKYCRDDPGSNFDPDVLKRRYEEGSDYNSIRSLNSGASLFITEMKALERRGLVWHDEPQDKNGKTEWITGHVYHKLTKIGELTCELLVESGLMPSKVPARRAKANKRA